MKKLTLLLALLFASGITMAQDLKPGTKGTQGKQSNTVQTKPENQNQQTKTADSANPGSKIVGTWKFVSAMWDNNNVSTDYFFGNMDGIPRTHIFNQDGSITIDPEVKERGFQSATWVLESDKTTGEPMLIINFVLWDGYVETVENRLLVADGNRLVFGKNIIVEFKRVSY